MNKEILLVVDTVSNEKGVEKEVIFEAIEIALAAATRKKHGIEIDVRVAIDRESGDYESFRRWLIMDDEDPEFESPEKQTLYSYAIQDHPDIQIGEYIEESIESVAFSRISAHTAKQVIVQKVREAERLQVVDAFRDRVGQLVMGIVKRNDHSGVYIDLGGNAEGFISREQMIPRESMRPGDRVRAFLQEVCEEARGPQLLLTRVAPEFLVELFKLEVPEVGQGLIEVLSAARDPGLRAKIAVKSNDPRLDPVGACVGMRGSRVQSVSNELAGERIDIILWDENSAQFVLNAMSPVVATSIIVDEDKKSMDIAVEEEELSQAIGRGGQNVKLACQLTGWELNVMTEGQAEEKSEAETHKLKELFMSKLDVDEYVAEILAHEGFSSIEEIAYVPPKELIEIKEFDKKIVEELRKRSRDVLLTAALAAEEKFTDVEPSADLLNMEGMDKDLAFELACRGISTIEDLSERAVDDLLDIEGLDAERAGALIMRARAPWFEKEDTTVN